MNVCFALLSPWKSQGQHVKASVVNLVSSPVEIAGTWDPPCGHVGEHFAVSTPDPSLPASPATSGSFRSPECGFWAYKSPGARGV